MHPTRTRGPPGNSSPAACHRWPGTRCPAGHSGPWAWAPVRARPRPQRPRRPRRPHHEVPAQHQGHDLRLGRRVAVVVTRQVPTAPPAGPPARLPVVARAEHAVEAEQQQHEDDAGGQAERRHPAPDGTQSGGPGPLPPAAPSSRALLVQGDVSVGLCHAWPLGTSLPEPIGPGLRRGPGAVAVLRVPPLQGLPRVQAERDRDDGQQADVPGTRQRAASARTPWEGAPCCWPSTPSLPSTRDSQPAELHDHPLGQSSPNGGRDTGGSCPAWLWCPTLALSQTPAPQQPPLQYGLRNRIQTRGLPSEGEGGAPGTASCHRRGGWQREQLTHLLANVML